MKKTMGLSGLAVVVGLFLSASLAYAGNLVNNPSFETSDLTGWTGLAWNTNTFPAAEDGTYSAWTPCSGANCLTDPDDYLYQNLSTASGQSYTFSFWYLNIANLAGPNELQAFWGGTMVTDLVNAPDDVAWHEITLTETATSSSTEIEFVGRNDPGDVYLDNVSVTLNSTPEPSTLVLTGVAVLLAALYRKSAKA